MHPVRVSLILGLVVSCLASVGPAAEIAKPKPAPPAKPKLTQWIPLFETASLKARKEKKNILAYFSGSDWDPFTLKLEKEVLNTDLFRDWAAGNVILFQADFPQNKKLSINQKSQNDRFKQKYSIIKVPTFILMDFAGVPFARGGFDEAKLREVEAKGEPHAWIKWLEEMIKNKPPDEALIRQKDLTTCLTYGRKHFISAVIIINKGRPEREMTQKDDLIHNQQFVRYMNHNVAYTEIEWPYDSDTSPEAIAFRNFAAVQNLDPVPLQLVVWDMQTNKVNFKLKAIDAGRADNIIAMIEQHLPKIDYNAGWIEDYRLATAIAQQQKRYILIAFTAMDSSDFSKKIFEEIFDTDEFKKYARKHLVTVKVDFPTATTQPAGTVSQNKTLAEMYAVRGFPYMIVLNPLAQKIGDAKYMKGGPEVFLKELQAAVKNDEDRRAFLSGGQ